MLTFSCFPIGLHVGRVHGFEKNPGVCAILNEYLGTSTLLRNTM